MRFLELQAKANKSYYTNPKTRIYYDFKTTSSACRNTAYACAKKIAGKLKKSGREKRFRIAEFGVGEGDFALFFLMSLKKFAPWAKIEYVLFDISKPLIEKAKKKIAKAKFSPDFLSVGSFAVDLANAKKFPYKKAGLFDYVASNEMYDDLPAEMCCRANGKLFLVELGKNLGPEKITNAPKELEGLSHKLPEGYFIPINTCCLENLKIVCKVLKSGCEADIFDYGFASYAEVCAEPSEFWNVGVARMFGTQITTDVNFEFLADGARKLGFKPRIEKQSEFLAAVLQKKYFCVELDDGLHYYTQQELVKNRKKLAKQGYSKEFFQGKIFEEEDYLHLELKK